MVSETRPYDNPATQDERKAILRNDSYFSRQQNTADDAGGRYAKLTPSNVIGSKPTPQYPSLPASSPWSQFDQNVEPVLGFSVDAMEPVGTPTEVQSSLAPNLATVAASPADVGDRANEGPVADVASLPASLAAGSSIKRRGW